MNMVNTQPQKICAGTMQMSQSQHGRSAEKKS